MKPIPLDFEQIPQLSFIDKAYQKQTPALRMFYEYPTEIEQFKKVIDTKKNFSDEKRAILVQELHKQYATLEISPATQSNIEALSSPNTFTITTAHQPNLFTGPLYSIYKIVSAINLAKRLKATYPAYHFVPVFWSGGEDHDFEEVNHVHLFGQQLQWNDEQGGSVGKYELQSLKPVLKELADILGNNENATIAIDKLNAFYSTSDTYGDAHLKLINWIFGAYGLVVLHTSSAAFKSQMNTIFKDELLRHHSKEILKTTTQELEKAGFSNQAYAREINLFYLTKNKRSRITKKDGQYQVLDTPLTFSEKEILQELDNHPERFSPNVILRPLFQETILPNLAYIGGGGELAYWLERKEQFKFFGVPYPMLIRRCSVLWIDKNNAKKLQKLGLSTSEIFTNTDTLLKKYTIDNTENELSLDQEKDKISQILEQILQKGASVDPSLKKTILGTQTQIINSLEKIEKKLIRAEKSKHENALNQIRNLKEKLFPADGLQERHDTFLAYYVRYGDEFLETLLEYLDPLEKTFLVLEEAD
jgi:bacillithiol biosynthesis cysteine-adding enzyme BshC